jgi:signal transduction histidine kinase
MKISQKLIMLFLLMALIPILVIGAFSYFNTQRVLNRDISTQIANTLTRQTNKINELIQLDMTKVSLFTAFATDRILLGDYDKTHSSATAAKITAELARLRQDDRSVRRMHVLDTNGIVVASSDPRFIGRDYSGAKVFQAGMKNLDVSMFFRDIDGVLGQYLTAPITLSGKLVGVGILEHESDSYSFITSDYVDVGKTGETFMVGPNDKGETVNLMPLRFNDQGALAAYRTRGDGSNTRDYRDQLVLQKTTEIPDTHWRLGVKIDQAEVYAPVAQVRNITLAIIVITTLLVTLVGWYFAHYITAPIKRFTEVAMRIRAGDLSQRVRVESGDEIGLLGTAFNEMTNNLVESRARLVASILSLPFGFGLIDDQNQVVFSNPLLGKLLGQNIPDDPVQSRAALDRINADFAHTVDLKGLIAESQAKRHPIERNIEYGPMFFRLFFAPIIAGDKRVLGTVLIVEDTTERMALERSRDEFFSIASHELRTPLTAVRGNSDMILNYFADQMKNPDLKTMVTDIHDASIRLIDIVNDFLDMSRLEQGRLVLKSTSFDIAELIQQTLREYDVTGSRRKLKLALEPPTGKLPEVFGDRERTRQVLINILGNALHFTKEGGVTFKLTPGKQVVEVSISDTGQGIPVESQHLLFRKFQQASANILTRDNTHSTGLGLYISKLLCEEMSGEIKLVSSVPGQGTTFAFTLPIATPQLVEKAKKKAAMAVAQASKSAAGV